MTVIANFSASQLGITPCTIRYTDTSTSDTGTIGCWEWTFPGGTITSGGATDEEGPHDVEFSTPGPHSVTLKAGESGTECCPVNCFSCVDSENSPSVWQVNVLRMELRVWADNSVLCVMPEGNYLCDFLGLGPDPQVGSGTDNTCYWMGPETPASCCGDRSYRQPGITITYDSSNTQHMYQIGWFSNVGVWPSLIHTYTSLWEVGKADCTLSESGMVAEQGRPVDQPPFNATCGERTYEFRTGGIQGATPR